jgi:hypothetical protein
MEVAAAGGAIKQRHAYAGYLGLKSIYYKIAFTRQPWHRDTSVSIFK